MDMQNFEKELLSYLPEKDDKIKTVISSMEYSLSAGGKRIRPFLVLEFAKLCGGNEENAMPFACAVEMIHTYSLIHDDLPCMDNDDLRRGKPTNHKVFGEAPALLGGDGLLTLAFETALSEKAVSLNGYEKCAKSALTLAKYAGAVGMIGGQIIDLESENKIAMDIGASTGGFTDCMLQNGAVKVYSIDVGHGQLDWKLRNDERVVNLERTNVRYVTKEQIPDEIDFFSVDVCFISLCLVLPAVRPLLKSDCTAVCLIKPQFEAGRNNVGKNGVVRDKNVHKDVIKKIYDFCLANGFDVIDLDFSPIKGPEGNIEYLLYIRKSDTPSALKEINIDEIVENSHNALDK